MTDNTNYMQSPCVRNCCLNENDICLGCFRTIEEIVAWSQSNSEERKTILLIAKQRANEIGSNYESQAVCEMKKQVASHSIRFRLTLSAEKYLEYYKGNARNIVVRSEDNKNIKFPANAIRSFLTHDGIFGLFEIQFDENNKLIKIIQID